MRELVAVFQLADVAQVEEDAIVIEEQRCLGVDIEMIERLILRFFPIVGLPRRLQVPSIRVPPLRSRELADWIIS